MVNQDQVAPAGKSGGITSRGIIAVVIIAALTLFIFQNRGSVPFNFLFIDFDLPIWLLIGASFVLGMVLDNVVVSMFRKAFRRNKPNS